MLTETHFGSNLVPLFVVKFDKSWRNEFLCKKYQYRPFSLACSVACITAEVLTQSPTSRKPSAVPEVGALGRDQAVFKVNITNPSAFVPFIHGTECFLNFSAAGLIDAASVNPNVFETVASG
jgi:hypothetical protein